MSGQQLGTVVGGVAGLFLPGGPTVWAGLGGALGGSFDTIPGRQLGAPMVQQYRDGVPITLGWGTFVTAGTVIDPGPVRKVKKKQSGKGGPKVANDHFIQTFGILFAEALDANLGYAAVTRVWENDRLVCDVRPGSTILAESERYLRGVTFYLGTADQMPDPELEAIHGAGNVPAYRGRLYGVWRDKDLTTDGGGNIPQIRVEVASSQGETPQPGPWILEDTVSGALTGVAFSQGIGKFAAVGGSGTIYSSTTGDNWELATTGVTWAFRSVAASNSLIVARRDFGDILLSTDGINWTQNVTATTQAYLVTVWTGARFVCAGFGSNAERSTDSTANAWVASALPKNSTIDIGLVVVGSPEGTVLLFGRSGEIFRSDDGGATWTEPVISETDPEPEGGFTGAATDGSVIRAYKFSLPNLIVYSSTDGGNTFTPETFNLGANNYRGGSIAFHRGVWYGLSGSTTTPGEEVFVFTSPNGLPPFTPEAVEDYLTPSAFVPTEIVSASDRIVAFGVVGGGTQSAFYKKNTPLPPDFGGSVPLSTIVGGISNRTRISQARRIVSELDDTPVRGLALGNVGTHGENIGSLMTLYHVDAPEYDGAIRFERRGKPVTLSIPEDDLIDDGSALELMREEFRGFPKFLHVQYQPQETDYGETKQTAQRRSNEYDVVGEISVKSLVNEDHVFHARCADVLMRVAWTEAEGKVECRLPISYLGTRPGQNIALPIAGKLTAFTIKRWGYDDGEIVVEAKRYRQSDFTSNVTGLAALPVTAPPPSIAGQTRFAWLNIPALVQAQDRTGYNVGMGPILPGWYGADLERSVDGGESWEQMLAPGFRATIGALVEPLGFSPAGLIDTTRTLRVSLPADLSLESVNDGQLMRRANAAAIRSSADDEPEIIQFRDAVFEGGNVWALTYLPRGVLNTPARAWPAGSTFVLLDDARFVGEDDGVAGQPIILRPTAFGESTEDSIEYPETFSPVRAQQEWAPLDLVASRDGGNLSLSVTPRWRLGSEIAPVRSADFDGWRWVVHSVEYTTTGPELTITDPGPDVSVSVAGLNRITGPGLTLEETV